MKSAPCVFAPQTVPLPYKIFAALYSTGFGNPVGKSGDFGRRIRQEAPLMAK
nr:MAG TPA: hypothetical protein [Caudoviricetes sp.]